MSENFPKSTNEPGWRTFHALSAESERIAKAEREKKKRQPAEARREAAARARQEHLQALQDQKLQTEKQEALRREREERITQRRARFDEMKNVGVDEDAPSNKITGSKMSMLFGPGVDEETQRHRDARGPNDQVKRSTTFLPAYNSEGEYISTAKRRQVKHQEREGERKLGSIDNSKPRTQEERRGPSIRRMEPVSQDIIKADLVRKAREEQESMAVDEASKYRRQIAQHREAHGRAIEEGLRQKEVAEHEHAAMMDHYQTLAEERDDIPLPSKLGHRKALLSTPHIRIRNHHNIGWDRDNKISPRQYENYMREEISAGRMDEEQFAPRLKRNEAERRLKKDVAQSARRESSIRELEEKPPAQRNKVLAAALEEISSEVGVGSVSQENAHLQALSSSEDRVAEIRRSLSDSNFKKSDRVSSDSERSAHHRTYAPRNQPNGRRMQRDVDQGVSHIQTERFARQEVRRKEERSWMKNAEQAFYDAYHKVMERIGLRRKAPIINFKKNKTPRR